MKKIYSFLLLMLGINSYSNPIAFPMLDISELYFDDFGNWNLELGCYEVNQIDLAFDSVFLYSTYDTVKLPTSKFNSNAGVIVITQDSLDSDFIIKRDADAIKVILYLMGETFEDELLFGNSSGAVISTPRKGQSISKIDGYYFVKDNSPTIGAVNDTLGMCGTVKGVVYDKALKPVPQRIFGLDFNFETTTNGEYTTRVYSRPTRFNRVRYKEDQYSIRYASITEIAYVMEPDSIIERNIYLLDTLTSGINNHYCSEDPVQIAPNPVSGNSHLTVIVDLPVITSNIWLELVSLDGKRIKKEKIRQKNNLIDAPLQEGTYTLTILLDNQIISSKKFVVKNE